MNEAENSEHEQYRVGAVVFRKRTVISCASNSRVKTHPLQSRLAYRKGIYSNGRLHAEVAAIIRARGRGDAIFVCRIGKSGDARLAKPCPACEEAIREAGIKHVWYTDSEGGISYYAVDS